MNRDNISSVVRTVDILISVDKAENILDEAAVKQYINKASDFLKIVPDEEELAAISREISVSYTHLRAHRDSTSSRMPSSA